jgi:hypothetical protein
MEEIKKLKMMLEGKMPININTNAISSNSSNMAAGEII